MFYYQESCPYAKAVLATMGLFQEKAPYWQIIMQAATLRFPSPTFRVGWEDTFINFYGAKQALEAIKMLENQVPFS